MDAEAESGDELMPAGQLRATPDHTLFSRTPSPNRDHRNPRSRSPPSMYVCCSEEHSERAWECNGCHRRFHSDCSAGAKKGERARPVCIECAKASADAVANGGGRAKRVRREV